MNKAITVTALLGRIRVLREIIKRNLGTVNNLTHPYYSAYLHLEKGRRKNTIAKCERKIAYLKEYCKKVFLFEPK